jgi:hypothetical protein
MYGGHPTFILCVCTTLAHGTISGVVKILQSETLEVTNSRSLEVLDKYG